MQQYGIIGYPLTHTLSPLFHNTLFSHYGIPACYAQYAIKENSIPDYISRLRKKTLFGLSVTAPYKSIAYTLSNKHSSIAEYTGVVNTLSIVDGLVYGDNFDVLGIYKTLFPFIHSYENMSNKHRYDTIRLHNCTVYSDKEKECSFTVGKYKYTQRVKEEECKNIPVSSPDIIYTDSMQYNPKALILGSGSTAISTIVALQLLGVDHIYVLARNKEALLSLADKFNIYPVYCDFEKEHEKYTHIINSGTHKDKALIVNNNMKKSCSLYGSSMYNHSPVTMNSFYDKYFIEQCNAQRKEIVQKMNIVSLQDMPSCSFIINTIMMTQTMVDAMYAMLPDSFFTQQTLVFDVHYNPYHSYFLQKAQQKGCNIVNGYTMFIAQACSQFTLWTSIIPTASDIKPITEKYRKLYI